MYAPITDAKEAEVEWFYDDLQDLELSQKKKKRCPFYHKALECKGGSQEILRITGKFGLGIQNEARQKLTEFCQENMLAIANTLFQQHGRQIYTWTSPSPDGQYRKLD